MSLSSFSVISNALRLNLFKVYPNRDKHVLKEPTMKKTININGMMCEHCEGRVKKALEAIAGVESAVASHTSGQAVVTLSQPVADEVLKQAVEAQDYEVVGIE